MSQRKKLFFYYGSMSSGKSLQLLATAFNFEERKIPYVIFKSEIDTRDGESVIHSRALGNKSCTSISTDLNLYELVRNVCQKDEMFFTPKVKWILVDEAQFLTPEQVDQLAAIADNLGINVMCFGLRTDFQTHLFPGSRRLFEVADDLIEVKSSCSCDTKTMFNARVDSEGNIVTEGAQVEVGGDERYVALCRKCYYERTGNKMYRKREEDGTF